MPRQQHIRVGAALRPSPSGAPLRIPRAGAISSPFARQLRRAGRAFGEPLFESLNSLLQRLQQLVKATSADLRGGVARRSLRDRPIPETSPAVAEAAAPRLPALAHASRVHLLCGRTPTAPESSISVHVEPPFASTSLGRSQRHARPRRLGPPWTGQAPSALGLKRTGPSPRTTALFSRRASAILACAF